ncbi:MAG: HD domain-containing protein [Candidatus Wallbacteria bacterium]|nr:HD domain-containing protein [Candidatus Wallbacteria bacterium]
MRVTGQRDKIQIPLEPENSGSKLAGQIQALQQKLEALEKINGILDYQLYLQTVFNEIIECISPMGDNFYDLVKSTISILRRLFDFQFGVLVFNDRKEAFLFDNGEGPACGSDLSIRELRKQMSLRRFNLIELCSTRKSVENSRKFLKTHLEKLHSGKSIIGELHFFSLTEPAADFQRVAALVCKALGLVFSNFFMHEERSQFQAHLSRQLETFKNLHDVSRLFAGDSSIDFKLREILARSMAELEGAGGVIQLLDENLSGVQSTIANSTEGTPGGNAGLYAVLAEKIFPAAEPVLFYQSGKKPGMLPGSIRSQEIDFRRFHCNEGRLKVKSAVSVPLSAGGLCLGRFIIISGTRLFTGHDAEILALYAGLAAQIWENCRLDSRNLRQIEMLSQLNGLAATYITLHQEEDIINLTLKKIKELFPAHFAAISLSRKSRTRITYGLYQGELTPEVLTRMQELMLETCPQQTFSSRHIPMKKIRLYSHPGKPIDRMECYAILPIFMQGKIRGSIGIFRSHGTWFTREETEVLISMASLLSLSVFNTRIFHSIQENYINTISVLAAAIDTKDHYTHSHSENVMKLSVAIARKIGLPDIEVENIRFASLLHDIGKIGIDDLILKKKGRLTCDEIKALEAHPSIGTSIIQGVNLFKKIAPLTYHHHEKYDGTGYPDHLKGLEIPMGSRIIAVADAFDAMTSSRPYHKPVSPTHALREIVKNKAAQFDPEVVDAFVSIMKDQKFPARVTRKKSISIEFIKEIEDF